MLKLNLVVIAWMLVIAVEGSPSRVDDISAAASMGRWSEVQKLLSEHAKETFQWPPELAADIKDLKPVPGGHVYGEAEFTYHSASNINGKKDEESGGHKVINKDGSVTEYDFKP